jgi:hypothetical protein
VKDAKCEFKRKFICNKETEESIRSQIAAIEEKIGICLSCGIAFPYLLECEIQKLGGNESGVFVRLSSRSPKDSVQENLYNIYLEERKLLLQEGAYHFSCIQAHV